MLFNSYIFVFLFLPLTLLGYVAAGRVGGRRWAFAWLVVMSFVYYGWWNPAYIRLLLVSIGVNYLVGLVLGADRTSLPKKAWLAFGVVFNLGLLGYFKYVDFFIDKLNDLFRADMAFTGIVLPLAISFFTFQQIAYLVDAYRGEAREYNFIDYCLFVTFFPQLIAGPIVHHKEMLPQFAQRGVYRLNPVDLSIGVTFFAIGLFKKVMIADEVATYATPVFDKALLGGEISPLESWVGVLAYTFQIYFDFSGYSDMAIGLARMFGIRLPLNFHSPYRAFNIIEFWHRWHMTLSRWLRDYLYIPLGGNRKGRSRRYANLMITMILGGLWHGAADTFIVWGTLHGLYLCINHAWRVFRRNVLHQDIDREPTWWGWSLGVLVTFLATVVAWVFFRAESFEAAAVLLRGMAGLSAADPAFVLADRTLIVLALLILLVWLFPNAQQIMAAHEPALEYEPGRRFRPAGSMHSPRWLRWTPRLHWAAFTAILLLLAILNMTRVSEFIYYQF